MNAYKKPTEILDLSDEETQNYLKTHPEKAIELGQTLISLDKENSKQKNRTQDMKPLNTYVASHGGQVLEEPVYYRGFFKTPIILAYLALVVFVVILLLVVFFTTGHF